MNILVILQQQYEFIHLGLSELVVCGETEVAATNFRIAINSLKKVNEDGMTGFEKQLKVVYNQDIYTHVICGVGIQSCIML